MGEAGGEGGEGEDIEGGLGGVDHRTVATILRGLADAADSWSRTEL